MRLEFGEWLFDSDTRQVLRGGRVLPLTPKAFQLLAILIRERPKAVSKEQLHRELWPDTFVVDANLANLVADLRAALGDDARTPHLIRTVQRFGYAFEAMPEIATDVPAAPGGRPTAFRIMWGDREVALTEGENLLGRGEGVLVWIDVHSVSRHHARIAVTNDEATIEDLGSKNGTWVNGERVTGARALEDGDHIRIGTVELTLRRLARGHSTETVVE
jgi:DNA-binding winged helix-turn-helix (wHTH) protein